MRTVPFLIVPLCCLGVLAAPIFNVVNLGTLGGTSSTAYGINSKGDTVGSAATASESRFGFENQNGQMRQLKSAGAIDTAASSINGSGQIAGTAYTPRSAQAGIWNNGIFSNLGTLGGNGSYGMAINESGYVAGAAGTASGQSHAFLYGNGAMTDLGTPGGTFSMAFGINDFNMVVGYGDNGRGHSTAFEWAPNQGIRSVGSLTPNGDSYAFAVNNGGNIAGAATAASGYLHAFFYLSGTMLDLGTLGGTSSYAYGANSKNQVAGYSYIAGGATDHAFLWQNNGLYDLNQYIDPSSGWLLNEAYAINDKGQVAGTGTLNGQSRAFRLDPLAAFSGNAGPIQADATGAPEPGTLALLGLGMALVGASRLRRRKSPPTP